MLRFTQRCCNYISIEEVYRIVQAKLAQLPSVCQTEIIDVRSTNEVSRTGLIPTAINIPLPILSDVLTDSDEEVNDYTEEEIQEQNKEEKLLNGLQSWTWKNQLNKRIVTDKMFRYCFGIDRPNKDETQLIFYCTSGIRSATAVEIAEKLGYVRVFNFSGSWLQWEHEMSNVSV